MEAAGGLPPPAPPAQSDDPSQLPPPPVIPSNFNDPIDFPFNPPPPNALPTMPPQTDQPPTDQAPPTGNTDSQHGESEDGGSGSENDDSDDDEDVPRWHHIEEDTSAPCKDEIDYIESREEHSALDQAYWEKETFFELNDPELIPLDSGTIEWTVEHFNGTKENPNNETLMRSSIVHIGGLDWQIKFYPHGVRGSEYPSVFLECVSMLSDDYTEFEDFDEPPFPAMKVPFLEKTSKIQRRRSVAAQLSVVMYNPAEPRVHEHQAEAHQFHKKNADFGWKYFTRAPRYDFHTRQHGQRRAMLQGDQLAFKAHIRVVQDPTGCMWEHGIKSADEVTAITGLRPYSRSLNYMAVALPLLHFSEFRRFVREMPMGTDVSKFLQPLLLKMYSRKRSCRYGSSGSQVDADVMEMLWRLSSTMHRFYPDGPEAGQFNDLVGSFHAEKGAAVGSSRLNTKDHPSIQAAVKNHPKTIARPPLLTLELQRQEHDKKDRKWKKITNKVTCEEEIVVGGTKYTLYAFITHCGHLRSSRYNSYVRPRGYGKGWYAYQDRNITRLTEKQARERHSGVDEGDGRPRTPENGYDSPFSEYPEPASEVTCVVMYVREDYTEATFNAPDVEEWVPKYVELVQDAHERPSATAVHEYFPDAAPVPGAQAPISEEEFARLQDMRDRIEAAAHEATPEPVLMDGEDVVMKDIDDETAFGIEEQSTTPQQDSETGVGTIDWLGQNYYEGHMDEAGIFQGGGHLINSSGDEYLGEFKDGKYHGYGKLIYSLNGDVYEGNFEDGVRSGQGKLTEAATSGNIYQGGWANDRRSGDFVLTGKVTEEDQSCCQICYDKDISTAFYDCGHVVACHECAAQVETCPVCRKRVVARLQLYGVKVSNY